MLHLLETAPELAAGGKPSTWLPPGGLVEPSCRRRDIENQEELGRDSLCGGLKLNCCGMASAILTKILKEVTRQEKH